MAKEERLAQVIAALRESSSLAEASQKSGVTASAIRSLLSRSGERASDYLRLPTAMAAAIQRTHAAPWGRARKEAETASPLADEHIPIDWDDLPIDAIDSRPPCESAYKPPPSTPTTARTKMPETPEEHADEFLRDRRHKTEVAALRAANEHLAKELESRQEQIAILKELRAQRPTGPIAEPNMAGRDPKRRVGTPVMLLSDLHVEERVDPSVVNGLNEWNLKIADKCLGECTDAFEWLSNDKRFDFREAIVWLGGDGFSGWIHDELVESNFLSPTQAVVWLQERYDRELRRLLAMTNFEHIRVVCNDGNHGRLTHKTRVSTRAANSLEHLLYQTLAARFVNEPRIAFQIAGGEVEYLDVYKTTIAFMHGDTFRYQGGIGGLLIPVRRGINELRKYRHFDLACMGHFHQRLDTGEIVVNGSLIGTTPYAMHIKATPEPRQQSFFVIDPKYGKCVSAPIRFSV